ncbi:MAG: hypothetical protein M3Y05_15020 [Gemmatimonadota bacterium]|nr:hypothetical protein [Gemmatimonadota bacterium]
MTQKTQQQAAASARDDDVGASGILTCGGTILGAAEGPPSPTAAPIVQCLRDERCECETSRADLAPDEIDAGANAC